MLIYGHRGASATEPENTLRAFAAALEAGVDGLEFDVRETRDGVPVIMHDRSVARTTGGQGFVDRMTLAEIATLRSGEERIPTLAEALNLAGDRVHLDVEIKQGGAEVSTLALLRRHPDVRWAISSFDWTVLYRIRESGARAELWPLATEVSPSLFAVCRAIDAKAVSLRSGALTEATVTHLEQAGLGTVVWTVNDATEAGRCQALGAFALCTNDPRAIRKSLSNA